MTEAQVMDIANSYPMWIAAGIAISLVIVQAFLFVKKSASVGQKMGITKKQISRAVKSSAIASIGPSLVVLTGVLALLVTIGEPMAWLRLSVIGSVMFESMAAGIGTEAVGVVLGTDPLTLTAYANAVWTMTLGALGWIVFATLSADKMPRVMKKFSGDSKQGMMVIAGSAMIGVFGSMISGHVIALNANTIAVIAGAGLMLLFQTVAEKNNLQWLKEWGLALTLVGALVITTLIS